MMALASGLMFLTRKLNRNIEVEPKSAIGNTGRAYITIPAKGKGKGQVEVSVSGRLKVVDAVSASDEIKAFRDVTVTDARDDGTLVVEPLD